MCIDGRSPLLPSIARAAIPAQPACGHEDLEEGPPHPRRRRLREKHAELRRARGSHSQLADFEAAAGLDRTGALVVIAIVLIIVFVR